MSTASTRKIRWLVLARLAVTAGLLAGGSAAMAGTIAGTKHDFSTSAWSGGQICIACHTPHAANTTVTDAPLWNHTLSSVVTYALYTSPTLNATTGQPVGTSKLCLSCHDGTVAVDSFGGATGGTNMGGKPAVGAGVAGLSDDHPISITYNTALATADGALFDPSTKSVTIGSGTQTKTGAIDATMLYSSQVQCASCHDVHNTYTASAPLLKVSKTASALCLTCHNK